MAGLSRTRPGLAALMSLFLISLTGIPGTAGFIAKFVVFAAAVNAGLIWLAILGVLMSVVSVYYYLRILVVMYMHEPPEEAERIEISSGEIAVLAVCAFGVLFFGIFPNAGTLFVFGDVQLLDWTRESVKLLFATS
jgi:NADH-quinone oxidoreductase subunit N